MFLKNTSGRLLLFLEIENLHKKVLLESDQVNLLKYIFLTILKGRRSFSLYRNDMENKRKLNSSLEFMHISPPYDFAVCTYKSLI